MFNISIKSNFNNLINKVDMIPIDMQSAVAEGVGAAQSDIENVINTNYQSVEISASSGGAEVKIVNGFEDNSDEIKRIVMEKIKMSYRGL
jgi:hypothetical protein